MFLFAVLNREIFGSACTKYIKALLMIGWYFKFKNAYYNWRAAWLSASGSLCLTQDRGVAV